VEELVTMDEKLEKFRGNCPFRQHIASKPGKYGIKIYALVDSRIFYIQNLEIYAGKQPEGPYQLGNSPADVLERMISPISGSGRNVTVDNWFTSVPLAMKLLKDHNLTLLRNHKKEQKRNSTSTSPNKKQSRKYSQWRTPEFFFFFWRGGGSTNSVEDRGQREWGSGGGSPLVRGSGGRCNLVQEISFHVVTFS
jgi:hypothetical protein